jgi:hypothetical protein
MCAWRYTGRAKVNPRSPRAFARSDRSGFWFNREDLVYQFEWQGPRLVNTRKLVHPSEYDRPFIFNKPIIYPPDPVPVRDPRPENFTNANNGSPVVPLPWPTQPVGPAVPMPPTPQYPVYVSPPPPTPPPAIFELPPETQAEE